MKRATWIHAGLLLACTGCSPGDETAGPRAEEVRGAPIDSAPARDSDEPAPAPPEAPTPASESVGVPTSPEAPAGHDTVLHGAAARVADVAGEPLRVEGDTVFLSFTHLAFGDYDPVEAELTGVEGELPAEVLALDGKRVSILGFMVPMEFEEDSVRTFILMRFPPGCCFGLIPSMDQWIDVEVADELGCDNVPARIIRVTGELDVGELRDDYGYLASVYRLRADAVEIAGK